MASILTSYDDILNKEFLRLSTKVSLSGLDQRIIYPVQSFERGSPKSLPRRQSSIRHQLDRLQRGKVQFTPHIVLVTRTGAYYNVNQNRELHYIAVASADRLCWIQHSPQRALCGAAIS